MRTTTHFLPPPQIINVTHEDQLEKIITFNLVRDVYRICSAGKF